jgi:trimethylamine--corrinoid protein Co-methyltransferase
MRYIRSRVEVLNQREIERIHQGSLEILREVGIQVPNDQILERLHAVGAEVTGDVVRLREGVIARMLAECFPPGPGEDHDGWAVNQGRVRVTSGQETMLLDHTTGRRRPGTLEDVLKGIAITNALPTVGWALPIVMPSDVPPEMAEIAAYRLGCMYSRKPFQVYFGLRACPYLMEMAASVAQATGQSRREVGFDFGFGIVSPLRFAADDLRCAMATASEGWPTSCFSFVVIGASSPASMAGALVLSNAERLACLTLMWSWGELGGYRAHQPDDPCIIEPRSLATSFGHPNLTTLAIANSQLSRFYGLRAGGGLALSDAKAIDFQSGFERGMGAAFSILTGGTIGNSGIIGPDEAASFEQLVLDDAALSAINWVTQGIDVSEEALALDVIKEAGIGGGFIDRLHTAQYLRREYWDSPLFTRQSWVDWEAAGADTLVKRAHQQVEQILAAGFPPEPVLPGWAIAKIDTVVARAWTELAAREIPTNIY